ncbi:MAG TPA: DUF1697 domain-containing protein [Chloroflexota bacterium]|nr:DUF1697 domain-containing protein [Chloroflexota bacterium]
MNTWAVLLRGVNVGGKILSMKQLSGALVDRGYQDVATYIQSGNVVLLSEQGDEEALCRDVEHVISHEFGLSVTVMARTPEELDSIVQANPFDKPGIDPKTLHVTFLSSEAASTAVATIDRTSALPDEFAVSGREIYLHCPEGYGRSMLVNPFWERQLRARATTRNWRTVNRMLEMSRPPQ